MIYFLYALAAAILWCAFLDTKPPFENVTGKVASFNPATQTVIIEWSAIKWRRCPGWRSGWMRETHPEPPPRLVEYLPRVRIAPAGFKGSSVPVDGVMTWRTDAVVPPSLQGEDTIMVADWEFSCNPVQYLFPIEVQSALVEIGAQPLKSN